MSIWIPAIPKGLLTGPKNSNAARLKVDSQQSSFEANTQFRFFDDCTGADAIPQNEILVYRFSSVNALNIQSRIINGWTGGRKYIVFPNDGNETITGGSFVDVSDQVYSVNNNLADSGLSSHPVSQVTVEKRIATAFTSPFKGRTGTAYRSDANTSRATDSYAPDSSRAGVAANQSFFLVFFDIAQNDPSEFLFTVAWEEVFK